MLVISIKKIKLRNMYLVVCKLLSKGSKKNKNLIVVCISSTEVCDKKIITCHFSYQTLYRPSFMILALEMNSNRMRIEFAGRVHTLLFFNSN